MKILCIDGGGIRGVFPAQILNRLEERYQQPIYKSFDLIVGTSTGAIIAAAVAAGQKMDVIVDWYRYWGPKVFKQRSLGVLKSFYHHHLLKKVLQDVFGQRHLAEVSVPLVIPAVNLQVGDVHLFKSHTNPRESGKIKLWEAVLSSCAAPLYFPPYQVNDDLLMADGGLWANNPSFVALIEALNVFGQQVEEVNILSLGTGKQKITFDPGGKPGWGLSQWIQLKWRPFRITPKLIDLALHVTSESITYQCQMLLGRRMLRLNQELGKEIPIDDIGKIDELIQLADQVYEQRQAEIDAFLAH
ncbi:patatin [Caldalkalibacillus thermarum]|uniref:CBASS cGAMP-activated phospholipase n=1 Tax=Caldalkalibacillus thermarum TaxID=296745 RepID=UPI0016637C01|nr:CBASS cGAMP-activated phospholipase [Caldalkalibacillus thermarum]GGK12022.1 patatin [Caldalkalibacillus thermarum]